MESNPWDVFMLVFTGTDRLGHYLWHYHRPPDASDPREIQELCSAVQDYYSRLDEILGELVKKAGAGTTVIVMSDHGMGPNNTKLVHWSTWMHERGWLASRNHALRLSDPDSWFRRLGLPRDKVGRAIRRVPGLAKGRLVKKARGRSSTRIHEGNSKAYCVPIFRTVAGIRINAAGEEKEALRREIVEELGSIVDPKNDDSVVQKVWHGEDYYAGPYAGNVPDILVILKPDYGCSYRLSNYSSVITGVQAFLGRGNHRPEGIFVASGPNVMANSEPLTALNIEDVAPTILYLMGLPIPSDMDGEVLAQSLSPSYLESQPIRIGEPLGLWPSEDEAKFSDEATPDEDEERIRDRLRGLGYID
jgi:predicted AlkP superfamily phosphohydrolase/phosphomutase